MTMRASDRDRDATVELLAEAASDGQLTLEEYAERVDVALAARLQEELMPLVSDLQQSLSVAPVAGAGLAGPAPAADVPVVPERVRTIMSSEHRQGRWRVPASMHLRTVMGEITLELQEAILTSHVTRIDARATMGTINLIVPEGVEVQMSGSAIMGEKKSRMTHAPAPGAPLVEVTAHVVMGTIEVRPPRAGSRGAARELRDAGQDAR